MSINKGSGSAHGGMGGAYQDEEGWEDPDDKNKPGQQADLENLTNREIIESGIRITSLDKIMWANMAFAFGAGAYHGFWRAQGIEIDMSSFEGSTLYGPTILFAGFASMKSILGQYGESNPGQGPAAIGGAIQCGIVTGAGYGLGWLAGKMVG